MLGANELPLRQDFCFAKMLVRRKSAAPPCGAPFRAASFLSTQDNLDKPRFSNCFTEKRGSSIVVRCFSFFVAPDLFFKIFQKKQYLYIGQRFREHSPIKQACKHFQMPVVSYNSAFGEAALYCRTELIFYASAEMLFSCIVLPVGFLPLE